jgi:hypothetical protein
MDEKFNMNKKDKMELSIQKKQQKEKVLVGKIIPHAGHIIWEINDATLEIKQAKFETKSFIIGQAQQNSEIIIRSGFSYVSALNSANALKKYKKGKNGSKELGNTQINPLTI